VVLVEYHFDGISWAPRDLSVAWFNGELGWRPGWMVRHRGSGRALGLVVSVVRGPGPEMDMTVLWP
jgi:hypothetical protein